MIKLDNFDRKLLAALQANGRLSNIDVAKNGQLVPLKLFPT
jgi:DNA-binding Lrp family transcriptional regulator